MRSARRSRYQTHAPSLRARRPASSRISTPPGQVDATPLEPGALLDLLDERLAGGRPTFLNAAPDRLPPGLADGLRARLPTLDPPS